VLSPAPNLCILSRPLVSYQLIYFGFNFHLATVQEDHSDHADDHHDDHADDHHDDHGMTGLHEDHDDVSALPSYAYALFCA
jgi:hypothetical protein